jgi:hypothetical protein
MSDTPGIRVSDVRRSKVTEGVPKIAGPCRTNTPGSGVLNVRSSTLPRGQRSLGLEPLPKFLKDVTPYFSERIKTS